LGRIVEVRKKVWGRVRNPWGAGLLCAGLLCGQ
jgi:hypothetical protein